MCDECYQRYNVYKDLSDAYSFKTCTNKEIDCCNKSFFGYNVCKKYANTTFTRTSPLSTNVSGKIVLYIYQSPCYPTYAGVTSLMQSLGKSTSFL